MWLVVPMWLVVLRIPVIALACAALYGLWRLLARGGGAAARIVGGGLLLRAVVGQALFWISWLRLPIARPLQLGDGFWFFAVDGPGYLEWAMRFVRQTLPPDYPSRFYVQLLGVFVAVFGDFASTGILLNCLAYLATCAMVLFIARRRPSGALLFSLAAISFGPSAVLWSLQPLKDTVFVFLVTALIAASAWWQDAAVPLHRAASIAALMILGYAVASLRWYFGAFMFFAWCVFALWSAMTAARRWRSFAQASALFLLIGSATAFGVRDDVPSLYASATHRGLMARVSNIATGFASVRGATTIEPGRRVQAAPKPTPAPVAAPPAPAPIPQPPPAPTPAPVPAPVPTSVPQPAAPPPPPNSPLEQQPASLDASRFVADAVATFVPRFIAQPLGLMRVGGGRGFWLMVDADTLVFDAVILAAFVWAVRARARGPLFVMLALLFVMTALPMVYVVNNFGTLFRLRGMLYLLAALVPVAVERDGQDRSSRNSASVQPARWR